VKEGWVLVRGTPKTPFSLKNFIAGMTHPTPGAPCIPRRWRPQPQHTRGDCTEQAAAQAVPDARQTMPAADRAQAHTPGRWTRCTGLHSMPDRPRGVIWIAAGAGERGVCPKLSKSGQPKTSKISTQKSVNAY